MLYALILGNNKTEVSVTGAILCIAFVHEGLLKLALGLSICRVLLLLLLFAFGGNTNVEKNSAFWRMACYPAGDTRLMWTTHGEGNIMEKLN